MKGSIVLTILAGIVCAGCGSSSTPPTVRIKTSSASAQFKPSDHMPAEALAAKKAAGD